MDPVTEDSVPRRAASGVVFFLMWLCLTGLAVAEVSIGVDIILAAYTGVLDLLGVIQEDYGREYWVGYNVQTLGAGALGIGVLILAIGSGEFFLRNYGTARGWRWAAYIAGGELLILVLGYFVAPDAGFLIDLILR